MQSNSLMTLEHYKFKGSMRCYLEAQTQELFIQGKIGKRAYSSKRNPWRKTLNYFCGFPFTYTLYSLI